MENAPQSPVQDSSAPIYPVRRFERTRIYPGYQFNAVYSLSGEDGLNTFRFIVLTIQKWMDEKIPVDENEVTDPMTFRDVSEKDFKSYILDENSFVWNVTYLDETHEWAARLRETDSFATPSDTDKPSEGRVFITRIAIKLLNEKEVGVGCKIDVIESDRMSPLPYAYRPKFFRWLFAPETLAPGCGLQMNVRQGRRVLSMSADELRSKTAFNDLKNEWKTDDNSLPWVFFIEAHQQVERGSAPVIPQSLPLPGQDVQAPAEPDDEPEPYDAQTTALRFAKSCFGYAQTFFVPAVMTEHMKNTFQLKQVEPGSVIIIDPRCYATYKNAVEAVTVHKPSDVLKKPFYERLREGVRTHGVRKNVFFGPLTWEKDLVIKKDRLKLEHSVASAKADSIEDLTTRNADYLAAIERSNASILALQEENRRLSRENSLLIADATNVAKEELARRDSDILILTDEVEKDEDKIAELRREIERLNAENSGLKAKLDQADSQPVLCTGNESDKFPGEIKDIVLSELAEVLKGLKENTRRVDVIRDLVDSNGYEHILEDRATELKDKLAGYTTMTAPLRSYLEGIGLTITADANHYKLHYYDDPRYYTTFAKTASDRGHGDMNAALEIIRKML